MATNMDPNCPTQGGMRPGCGAIVAMLEAAAGVKAFSVGKPSPVMLRAARKELGLSTDETVVIGDTMETDILGGVQMGYRTILVLSGGTEPKDLARFAYCPDRIVKSIGDLEHTEIMKDFFAASIQSTDVLELTQKKARSDSRNLPTQNLSSPLSRSHEAENNTLTNQYKTKRISRGMTSA